MYRELDVDRIMATLEQLHRRICERFPESGLGRVAEELSAVARESKARIEWMLRPLWGIRVVVGCAITAMVGVVAAGAFASLQIASRDMSIADLLQGIEAVVQDVIFLGIAVFFLLTLEGRIKRRASLRGLHELRSIAHIVDMHQLTKDPEQFLSLPAAPTTTSPARNLTRFQMARYLDYCSELLSLTSKLAAVHAQYLKDPVVLDGVNDVESLAGALSVKIWQKTMILDSIAVRSTPPDAAPTD